MAVFLGVQRSRIKKQLKLRLIKLLDTDNFIFILIKMKRAPSLSNN